MTAGLLTVRFDEQVAEHARAVFTGPFLVAPNCEHDDETCQCVCVCGGRVWHDHAAELWGPVNWDLPVNAPASQCNVICPDAPMIYSAPL